MRIFTLKTYLLDGLIETYLEVPEHMAGENAPDIKTLPPDQGDTLMAFATAFKNCEIVAQKQKLNFHGYINNKLKVDRPITDVLKN